MFEISYIVVGLILFVVVPLLILFCLQDTLDVLSFTNYKMFLLVVGICETAYLVALVILIIYFV
jgi:hypothetical protein